MHWCKKSIRWKSVFLERSVEHTLPPDRLLTPMHVNKPYKNCAYNCHPVDEPTRFETCRRPVKNWKIEL